MTGMASAFYDREGKEISDEEGLARRMREGERRIDQTEIDDFRISTVFLGMGSGSREGKPLIYETMIFGDDEILEEKGGYRRLYATEEEARTGHEEAIAWARENLIT
jgi:hypothetical protein